jgi:hypothetical protein
MAPESFSAETVNPGPRTVSKLPAQHGRPVADAACALALEARAASDASGQPSSMSFPCRVPPSQSGDLRDAIGLFE